MAYDYGCLMLKFKVEQEQWNRFINALIKPEDVYTEEEGYGIEYEPHVTILYGIHHDKFNLLDLQPILQKLNTIKVSSKQIDAFQNDKFDVLKFNIDSPDLHAMNKKVCNSMEYTNDYPDYHPHATIAYLKPGTSSKYIRTLSKPYILEPMKYKYSAPDDSKIYFEV